MESAPNEGTLFPSDLEEVQTLVRLAQTQDFKLTLVGSKMSQNRQNEGGPGMFPINLIKLNKIKILERSKAARIYGNVTFSELEVVANEFGLATIVRPGSGIFGILSSISTNVHGWDFKSGTISNTVLEIYALDSEGNRHIFEPEDDGFKDCVGSFGSTYLMYGAMLALTDNVLLEKVVTAFDTVREALQNFPNLDDEEIDLALITIGPQKFYLAKFYVVSREPQVSQNLIMEGPKGSCWQRFLIDFSRLLIWLGLKPILDWIKEKYLVHCWTPTETKLRNEWMNVPVNFLRKRVKGLLGTKGEFWLVEYFVPSRRDMVDLVEMYREEFKEQFVTNAAIRFVKADEAKYFSSIAPKGDMWALVICWDQLQDEVSIRFAAERNERFLQFLEERRGLFYMPYKNSAKDIVAFYPDFAMKLFKQPESSVFSNAIVASVKEEERKRKVDF